ncbi:hypothetical protein IMZ48_46170 [Candidatus Bathyarchaeota archaeon]|nr:hypothetical protein [Candidatus Bathyarchaeota archaeon]
MSTVWDDGNTIAHDLCDYYDGVIEKKDIASLTETILGANINLDARNKRGQTPLLLLSTPSHFSNTVFNVMTALLKAGADPMAQDQLGKSPVLEAAKSGTAKYVEAFLETNLHQIERGSNGGSCRTTDTHGVEDVEQRFYWKDWELPTRVIDWDTARQIVFNLRSLLAEDVDSRVRKSAFVVLARKHVGFVASAVAEGGHSPPRREGLRKELNYIIRDNRARGCQIPVV